MPASTDGTSTTAAAIMSDLGRHQRGDRLGDGDPPVVRLGIERGARGEQHHPDDGGRLPRATIAARQPAVRVEQRHQREQRHEAGHPQPAVHERDRRRDRRCLLGPDEKCPGERGAAAGETDDEEQPAQAAPPGPGQHQDSRARVGDADRRVDRDLVGGREVPAISGGHQDQRGHGECRGDGAEHARPAGVDCRPEGPPSPVTRPTSTGRVTVLIMARILGRGAGPAHRRSGELASQDARRRR